MVTTVSKKDYLCNYHETLCLSCVNGRADRCAFIAMQDPEEGLEKVGANAVNSIDRKQMQKAIKIYKVIECPNYEQGNAYRHTPGGNQHVYL